MSYARERAVLRELRDGDGDGDGHGDAAPG
jgi:hypothetical protein